MSATDNMEPNYFLKWYKGQVLPKAVASVIVIKQGHTMTQTPAKAPPRPIHSAIFTVVGWTGTDPETGNGLIGPIPLDAPLPEEWPNQRVRAKLYPGPQVRNVNLNLRQATIATVRPARPDEHNDLSFELIGHLLMREYAQRRLKLEVVPQRRGVPRRVFWMYATTEVMQATNPEWTDVHIRGCLLGNQLLAEQIEPMEKAKLTKKPKAKRKRKTASPTQTEDLGHLT